jgi:hypothetical protein
VGTPHELGQACEAEPRGARPRIEPLGEPQEDRVRPTRERCGESLVRARGREDFRAARLRKAHRPGP